MTGVLLLAAFPTLWAGSLWFCLEGMEQRRLWKILVGHLVFNVLGSFTMFLCINAFANEPATQDYVVIPIARSP